jgi:type VI secretion system lysozyme-like protein
MLNTRYDDSAAVPDYGLPSIVDLDLVNRGEDLRRAIEQTIRSYEPRIDNVRVHRVPADAADRWKVRFQITARPVADKKVKFQYDAVVDSSGAWKVTS